MKRASPKDTRFLQALHSCEYFHHRRPVIIYDYSSTLLIIYKNIRIGVKENKWKKVNQPTMNLLKQCFKHFFKI